MDPFKGNHNDTTKFLLPILFPDLTHDKLFSNYFEQAYIGSLDTDTLDDTIILKFQEEDSMEDFISDNTIYHKDNIVAYAIPDELNEEYERFLSGKYSKFKEESKQNILDFWDEEKTSLLYGILYKTEEGKEILLNTVQDKKLKNRISSGLENEDIEFWPPPNIILRELTGT